MVDLADVTVVLTQDRLLQRRFAEDLAALMPDLPSLRHVATLGTSTWDELLAGAAPVGDDELDARIAAARPEDPALVIFSSGTTSTPKGMLHCHRAPTLQFWVQAQIFGRHEATRMWTALPIFWTAGLNTAMGSTLAAGGCWVVQEAFDPGEALALLARERVTEPYALPHQIGALEEHPDWPGTDLSSLTCVYGKSALARHPSVTGDPHWFMPVGYGLSETCAFFCSHWSTATRDEAKRSMGRLLPGNRLRVVDPDTGEALGVDEDGELAIAGPTLMLGYLGKDPAQCFDADGFFRTGDLGTVDADGYVVITGRLKDVIIRKGENISAREVEDLLFEHPKVADVAVIGLPDPASGERCCAVVAPRDAADPLGFDEMAAWLRSRGLMVQKIPEQLETLDALPRNPAGKVQKQELRRRYAGAPPRR
jgi:acyl-CoA synthetase (AMP-forming)/AMP-acid ligase II